MILAAVGDVCLGLEVRKIFREHGYRFLFANVIDELLSSDIRFGNLEVVFIDDIKRAVNGHSQIWAENRGIKSLSHAQFNVMSFANNHIMDFGNNGFYNTIKLISKENIFHVYKAAPFMPASIFSGIKI